MKKIFISILAVMTLAIGFAGCGPKPAKEKTYRGTVNVTISNNTNIPLKISNIEELNYYGDVVGNYNQGIEIAPSEEETFEIPCKIVTAHSENANACSTKITCYYNSGAGGTPTTPFAGRISGSTVTIYTSEGSNVKLRTSQTSFNHTLLELKTSNPSSKTSIYSFKNVTNPSDSTQDYVLCIVS